MSNAADQLEQPYRRRSGYKGKSLIQSGSLSKRLAGATIPIRLKITVPYLFLAFLITLGVGVLAARIVLENVDERFNNQLFATGRLVADAMVNEENRLLETLRLLAYSEGVPEAISSGDPDELRRLAYGLVVNNREDQVIFLDNEGRTVLAMEHKEGGNVEEYNFVSGGEVVDPDLVFVQSVLTGNQDSLGDKYAGVGESAGRNYFFVSGPIYDGNGDLVGAVIVGKLIKTLATQFASETAGQVTFYDNDGAILASTFPNPISLNSQVAEAVLDRQKSQSLRRNPERRDLDFDNLPFSEIVGPWEARGGEDLGLMGVSLVKSLLITTRNETRGLILGMIFVAVVFIVFIGARLAGIITNPLLSLVHASKTVAEGNLQVEVPPESNDEIAVLTRSFNLMVRRLRKSQYELIEAYDKTLEGWSKALELRDKETNGHTERVTRLTVGVARQLRPALDSTQIDNIRRGALLHDIGKMGVPDRILRNPGELNSEEWAYMRRHPEFAYDMLNHIPYLAAALEIPYAHHERWDGTGYPRGLKGLEIPLSARLFALADSWDAITTDRPYRKRSSIEEAVRRIEAGSGTQFDPDLVPIFIDYVRTHAAVNE